MDGFIHDGTAKPTRAKTVRTIQETLKSRAEELRLACGNHQSQLARQLGVEVAVVNGWFRNGRISPWGALIIEDFRKVLGRQFTAKYLRPDIIDWDDIKRKGRYRGRV